MSSLTIEEYLELLADRLHTTGFVELPDGTTGEIIPLVAPVPDNVPTQPEDPDYWGLKVVLANPKNTKHTYLLRTATGDCYVVHVITT